MNAVDTNVLVYSLDVYEPAKQAKAQTLLADLGKTPSSNVLPWQVAGEFLNWWWKWQSRGQISTADVETRFRDALAMFPLVVPTARTFVPYFSLRARFSLSHWDTMLLAACKEAGVTTLYSEDLQAGIDYDGVVIVNPFAG